MKKVRSGSIPTFVLLLCLLSAGTARAEAIRELVSIQGAPSIPVEGIGIVTGLANTGDKNKAALDLLRQYMSNRNFNFDASSLATGNIALVRVKAEIPPFSRAGHRLPVSVSSIGDAKSLVGGELLMCDLYDNYLPQNGLQDVPLAQATGQVVTGAGILTRGTIPDGENTGAQLLVPYPLGKVVNSEGIVRLNLRRANWNDAYTIASRINQTPALNPNLQDTAMFAETEVMAPVAFAKDAGQVLVKIPNQYRYDVTRYISGVLAVPVAIDRPATIVINKSKNTIVVTGDVRVNNAMVSLQDKTVTIRPEPPEEPAAYTLEDGTPRNLVELEGPGTYADMQGLIDTLNAMGLTTEQIIIIFEQLRASGAITAELINQ